jgi:hypothetical protein
VARDLRLALSEQLCELADRELLQVDERQEAHPHGIGQQSIELPPGHLAHRRGGGEVGVLEVEFHRLVINCIDANECK